MDIHDLPDYLRRLAREKPRELAQARADKIQALYDGVLRDGAGKDIEEVKALLAERLRAAFGAGRGDPPVWASRSMSLLNKLGRVRGSSRSAAGL